MVWRLLKNHIKSFRGLSFKFVAFDLKDKFLFIFNFFVKVELAEKVLMRENKDSSLFWACLQELSNRVKRLIKETEDLNAKEFERRKKSDHETRRFFENSLIFNSFPKPDALQCKYYLT